LTTGRLFRRALRVLALCLCALLAAVCVLGSAAALYLSTARGKDRLLRALVTELNQMLDQLFNGVEAEVPDGRALAAGRAQALVDAGHGLQPVGVVVGDEPAGRVQDDLGRPVVLGQDDLARVRGAASD